MDESLIHGDIIDFDCDVYKPADIEGHQELLFKFICFVCYFSVKYFCIASRRYIENFSWVYI